MKRYNGPNRMGFLKYFIFCIFMGPSDGPVYADVVIPREERVTTRLVVREGPSTSTLEVGELLVGESAVNFSAQIQPHFLLRLLMCNPGWQV